MNTKLLAICDSQGRPQNLFVTAGQVSDYIGAQAMLSSLPKVNWLLRDHCYDADWFRETLKDKRIRPCTSGRKQRKTPVNYDNRRNKRRNRIEIMFGRPKDWRHLTTQYNTCPKVFLSEIALAASVIYWPRTPKLCKDSGASGYAIKCRRSRGNGFELRTKATCFARWIAYILRKIIIMVFVLSD